MPVFDPVDEAPIIEPRADEQLPVKALEPYLREHLPQTDGALRVRQFSGGKANLTYLLNFGEHEYVLRRPPLGPVAASAHDMGREHRVLSRLSQHFPLAPNCYVYCADDSIIGAPFQVMERRHGQVVREVLPDSVRRDARMQRRIGEMLIDVLASFHLVDRATAGLDDLGHPDGFARRQLDGWSKRWYAAAHEDNSNMNELLGWLDRGLPTAQRASLIHNDYKLDNLLVGERDPARCVAILDWDMCTSGDPLMDLGYLMNLWANPDDPPRWIEEATIPSAEGGFLPRGQAIERYALKTGLDAHDVNWYIAFAAMKFAVIVQQIYIRYRRGQTRDARFANYHERAAFNIEKGLQVVQQHA